MALIPVPSGEIATVVTFLEMTERPLLATPPPSAGLRLERASEITPEEYRQLFRRVGGRWLWYSRLAMDDASLAEAIGEVHLVRRGAELAGFVELDFRTPGECLIAFLGLVPELAGGGHSRWLFASLLDLAWREGISRIRVNTCTLDHPAALKAYLAAGFRARGCAFESFPDPRLAGLLPRDVAPQVPLAVDPASCA